MGPPSDPPNCSRLKGTFSALACLVKKSLAFSASSRANRNPEPWTVLVPDFVRIVSAAPAERPSVAVNWLVASWNCSSPSVVKVSSGPPYWLSRLSAPSTVGITFVPDPPP
jgi:hypothetical protein